MPEPADNLDFRIREAVELVREVSAQTDPQEMVRRYRERSQQIRPIDDSLSISRRDLKDPRFRITRSSRWADEINPWKEPDRLPVLSGGLVAELVYGNEPRLIEELKIAPDDPAAEYFEGIRSLFALPLYDRGESLNMVLLMMNKPNGIDPSTLPDWIITGNLFGRATHNLVMAEQVRRAYEALDSEFQAIAEIQRSLLPQQGLKSNGLDVASYYATAHRAGGDYFDFFDLDDDRSGILIADVSGHGAAAAVVMARLHATLRSGNAPLDKPADALEFANEHLLMCCEHAQTTLTFVTAFYCIFDPRTRTLTYASAGHNPPRWRRADGCMCSISGARSLPLGIECGVSFEQDRIDMTSRDEIVLFTDGIVEAFAPSRDEFGVDRLDGVIAQPHNSAQETVDHIITDVHKFTADAPATDDQTLLSLRVS